MAALSQLLVAVVQARPDPGRNRIRFGVADLRGESHRISAALAVAVSEPTNNLKLFFYDAMLNQLSTSFPGDTDLVVSNLTANTQYYVEVQNVNLSHPRSITRFVLSMRRRTSSIFSASFLT